MNEARIYEDGNKDPIAGKHRVFQSIPGFKEWIEQTSLFQNIKRFAGTGIIIEGIPNGLRLQLDGISKIEIAEDLPIEMIREFFINSPFYKDTVESKNNKLI